MLAMTAAGLSPSLSEAAKLLPKAQVQHPIAENTNRYQAMQTLYQACYWKNKDILKQVSRLREES